MATPKTAIITGMTELDDIPLITTLRDMLAGSQ